MPHIIECSFVDMPDSGKKPPPIDTRHVKDDDDDDETVSYRINPDCQGPWEHLEEEIEGARECSVIYFAEHADNGTQGYDRGGKPWDENKGSECLG